MGVFVKGKKVVTDTRTYAFADAGLAEKFINCLVSMDEISSCKEVPAVTVTERPVMRLNLWTKLFYLFQQTSGGQA